MGTGCHFAENGQLRQALQLGESFFIRTYCSTVPCRQQGRESVSQGQGGRVCLHFFKNTLCALMAAVLRGSLLNRVFYALFYLCKIMFQLNETRAVIARNYIRATTAILCCCCPVHATPLLHPPFMRKDSWRTAAMRCN